MNAENWIKRLALEPHPEGGFYKENYRSELTLGASALPENYGGDRSACTSIYYLLEQGDFSAFHRIVSDEHWHFYDGDALEVFVISPEGALLVERLGRAENEKLFTVVPGGCWFASRPAKDSAFSLVGCTVAPGFDFDDFEMGKRELLADKFPQHAGAIRELTRC